MTDLERLDAEIRRLKDELAAARECLRMTGTEAERRLTDENAELRQKLKVAAAALEVWLEYERSTNGCNPATGRKPDCDCKLCVTSRAALAALCG